MGGAQLVHIGIATICINHVLTSPITPCPPNILDIHKGYGSAAIFQGNFNTRLYNKRDVLSFLIVNFLFFNSDVPLVPSYSVL
jgi:hypothetical protein